MQAQSACDTAIFIAGVGMKKELYCNYGLAMQALQLLESQLASLSFMIEANEIKSKGELVPDSLREDLTKLTLGGLLTRINLYEQRTKHALIAAGFWKELRDCKRLRDDLAHSFFLRMMGQGFSNLESSCKDLEVLRNRFEALSHGLSAFGREVWKSYGLTEAQLDAEVEERIRKLASQ
jgi:hypothetical protein